MYVSAYRGSQRQTGSQLRCRAGFGAPPASRWPADSPGGLGRAQRCVLSHVGMPTDTGRSGISPPLLPEIGLCVQNKTWFMYIILSTKQIVTGILGIDLLNTCPVPELDKS